MMRGQFKRACTPFIILFALISNESRSQIEEPDSTKGAEITIGVAVALDHVFTDLHPNWSSAHFHYPTLYEDTKRIWFLDYGQIALDGFIEITVSDRFTTQARIGITYSGGGPPEYFPEVDLLAKYNVFSAWYLKGYIISGFFAQRSKYDSRYLSGIEGGAGIDLPYLPAVEFIIQRPFVPLAYESWPSGDGSRVNTSVHHWSWRIGIVILAPSFEERK